MFLYVRHQVDEGQERDTALIYIQQTPTVSHFDYVLLCVLVLCKCTSHEEHLKSCLHTGVFALSISLLFIDAENLCMYVVLWVVNRNDWVCWQHAHLLIKVIIRLQMSLCTWPQIWCPIIKYYIKENNMGVFVFEKKSFSIQSVCTNVFWIFQQKKR